MGGGTCLFHPPPFLPWYHLSAIFFTNTLAFQEILWYSISCPSKKALITDAEVAQLVEHNLAKVGVAGSSPVFRSIFFKFVCMSQAGVAELADAQDLKSCGRRLPYRFDSGPRHHWFAIKSCALSSAG